jgi:hypothetical protein
MDEGARSKRVVYRGDIPGDFYEGRWPNRLTIYAASGPEGLTLDGVDSIDWPDRDMYWTTIVAPESLSRLHEALVTAADAKDIQLVDLIAARLQDQTIPVRDLKGWLDANGIANTHTTRFYEN